MNREEWQVFTPEEAISLCRMLQELDAEARVLVASFSHETMVAFREECPSVATSATLREGLFFYKLHRLRLASLYRGPAVALQVPNDPRVIETGFFERAKAANIVDKAPAQVWTTPTGYAGKSAFRARESRQYPGPRMDDQ